MTEQELLRFVGAYGYIKGVNALIAEVRRLQAEPPKLPRVTKKDLKEGLWYVIKYRHHDPEMAKYENELLFTEFQGWDPGSVVILGPVDF